MDHRSQIHHSKNTLLPDSDLMEAKYDDHPHRTDSGSHLQFMNPCVLAPTIGIIRTARLISCSIIHISIQRQIQIHVKVQISPITTLTAFSSIYTLLTSICSYWQKQINPASPEDSWNRDSQNCFVSSRRPLHPDRAHSEECPRSHQPRYPHYCP